MMTTEEMVMYDMLVDLGVATPEEINLCFNLAALSWTETLENILYIRTGYRSIPQMLEAEDEEDF